MGMFLTKYSMLKALGFGADTNVLSETKKILSKYKLFGIILHDPLNNIEFDKILNDLFEKLDYITGKHFLFLTLINPKTNWYNESKRDYFGIWEEKELLNPNNAYDVENPSIASYTLAKKLNIPYDSLPVVILTNNLSENKIRYIKTNEKYIEKQLSEIGFFCNQVDRKFDLTSDLNFNKLLAQINPIGDIEDVTFYDALAKRLTEFLSFIISNRSYKDGNDAKDIMLKYIQSNFKKSYLNDENNEEDGFLSFLGSLSNVKPFTKDIKSSFIADDSPSPYRYLESPPIEFLKTTKNIFDSSDNKKSDYSFNSLTNKVEQLEQESTILINTVITVKKVYNEGYIGQLDFSPIIVGMSKVFEIELNLSIVHWIRKILNIEMPDYFNIRKDCNNDYSYLPDNIALNNPESVNFNNGFNSMWRPPGIGQSELVFKSLLTKGKKPFALNRNNHSQLLNQWTTIRQNRNKASHMNVMTFNNLADVEKAFYNLIKKGFLDKMLSMKQQLRTNPT